MKTGQVKIEVGHRDTNLPVSADAGPADTAKKMIRKVGVNKAVKEPKSPRGIGIGKKVYALKNMGSAQW